MRKIIRTLLFAAVAGTLLGCGQANTTEKNKNDIVAQEKAEDVYVVEFSGTTTDGASFSSENFADSKLTMINAWATYCGPCINEMPDLGAIASEYDTTQLQLLGVICDVTEDATDADKQTALEIIEETGADYTHIWLSESIYTDLVGASDSVPTTYFVNEDGELLGYLVGARSKEQWEDVIDELLAEMQ